MLVRDRVPRVSSTIYPKTIASDRYGNEKYTYTEASETIEILWSPLSSESDVAEYGSRVNEMLQGVFFDNAVAISENDRVEVKGTLYLVKSIKPYPTYRLVVIERV